MAAKHEPVKMIRPATTPAPSQPPVNIAAEAKKNIAAVKTGADPFAPIRYTYKFIGGTIIEGLNGMANWGRRSLKFGIILGIVAVIATGGSAALATAGLSMFLGVVATTFVAAAAVGAAKGVLTGGMNAVGRDIRAKKYADDLVYRKQTQDHAGPNLHDYRAQYRQQQLVNSRNTELLVRSIDKDTQDYNTYWRDRIDNEPREKGLGF
jgi:hypothetical protein